MDPRVVMNAAVMATDLMELDTTGGPVVSADGVEEKSAVCRLLKRAEQG